MTRNTGDIVISNYSWDHPFTPMKNFRTRFNYYNETAASPLFNIRHFIKESWYARTTAASVRMLTFVITTIIIIVVIVYNIRGSMYVCWVTITSFRRILITDYRVEENNPPLQCVLFLKRTLDRYEIW